MARSKTLAAAELAERADTSVERVSELVMAGLLAPGLDGRHRLGDVHLVRIFDALAKSGIPMDVLGRAARGGPLTLVYYDRLHPPPGRLSTRTYATLKRDLGERSALLPELHAAFGLAEPAPHQRLERGDEELLVTMAEILGQVREPDLVLRVLRLLGDSVRRTSEAVLGVYDEAASRVYETGEGVPPMEAWSIEPWLRLTRTAPELERWLTARHLSSAIDAWCVAGTERYLALAGYVPPPDDAPPAVAFVDLSGFTRMAETRGDEQAARTALAFARLAERHATAHDGRLVKVLGDGVLLWFGAIEAGVEGTLALLGALSGAGLPPGHAGIDAGPMVMRDGDVFGRTVNLASRISDVAEPGALLGPASLAARLPTQRFEVVPMGTKMLAGIPDPTELIRIGLV